MQAEALDAAVVEYIDEIKSRYEHQIHKLKTDVLEYRNKYLEMEERYKLLIYKRFVRSAERIPADYRQPLLFGREAGEPADAEEPEPEERTEVKSHGRKKPGRKPLDPSLPRVERIVDIAESGKTCVCGAGLTKTGEETAD